MRFLFRLIGPLFVYMCMGTVLALGIGGGYLVGTGKINREKFFRLMAVYHDVDIESMQDKSEAVSPSGPASAQVSFEDIERARAMRSRTLEFKQQALEKAVEEVRFVRLQLSEDKLRHTRIKTAFDEKLATMREGTRSMGYANVRLIWENIKPKQAKEQILQMMERNEIEDIVVILSDMPIGKRAKIVSQFTTPEEVATLDTILRLIRKGGAEGALIDETRRQLQQAQANN